MAESNYKVSNETPDMVEFYRTPWCNGSYFRFKNIADKKSNGFILPDNATYVQLTYYINILPVILCLIISIGLYLQNEYNQMMFFGIGCLVVGIYCVFNYKSGAESLLRNAMVRINE